MLEVDGVRIRSPWEVYKAILAAARRCSGDSGTPRSLKGGKDAERKIGDPTRRRRGSAVRVAPLGEPQVSVKIRGQNVEVQPASSPSPADPVQLLQEAMKRYLSLIDKQRQAISELQAELLATRRSIPCGPSWRN